MRAVLQRVREASVTVEGKEISSIKHGLMVLLGVEENDGEEDVKWLAKKIAQLRIFEDEEQVPNLDINQVNGEVLLISQFTLHAKTKKGNRPSYIRAAEHDQALRVYKKLWRALEEKIIGGVKAGAFGANMQVALINDGPHTLYIDTKNRE